MKELRPVEAFCLMLAAGEEEFSDEDSLKAVLVYLAADGFIKPVKNNFVLTEKGENAFSSNALREYEIDILQAIREEKPEDMVNAIDSYSFKQHFIDTGFFAKVPVKFLFFRYRKIVISDKGDNAISELLELREKIKTLFTQKKKPEEKEIMLAYAFPSITASSRFKKYAKEIVGEAESATACRLASMAAAISIVDAMNTNNNIATTNFYQHRASGFL